MEDDTLLKGMGEVGLKPLPVEMERLHRYVDLLLDWNGAYNLTGARDRESIVVSHILDCLSIHPHLYGKRIMDVGSGAGLPAFPLAIACPRLQVSAIDSRRKKMEFQRYAAHQLELVNINVICARVETYRPEQNFDTLVCRAYSSLQNFVRQTVGLCRSGGRLLAMKGAYPQQELKDLDKTLVSVLDVVPINVPGLAAERCLVLMAPCEHR